ncbi:hypothetical protein N9933_00020 [bacterium]|nr:hypothetical protein [bacterium]
MKNYFFFLLAILPILLLGQVKTIEVDYPGSFKTKYAEILGNGQLALIFIQGGGDIFEDDGNRRHVKTFTHNLKPVLDIGFVPGDENKYYANGLISTPKSNSIWFINTHKGSPTIRSYDNEMILTGISPNQKNETIIFEEQPFNHIAIFSTKDHFFRLSNKFIDGPKSNKWAINLHKTDEDGLNSKIIPLSSIYPELTHEKKWEWTFLDTTKSGFYLYKQNKVNNPKTDLEAMVFNIIKFSYEGEKIKDYELTYLFKEKNIAASYQNVWSFNGIHPFDLQFESGSTSSYLKPKDRAYCQLNMDQEENFYISGILDGRKQKPHSTYKNSFYFFIQKFNQEGTLLWDQKGDLDPRIGNVLKRNPAQMAITSFKFYENKLIAQEYCREHLHTFVFDKNNGNILKSSFIDKKNGKYMVDEVAYKKKYKSSVFNLWLVRVQLFEPQIYEQFIEFASELKPNNGYDILFDGESYYFVIFNNTKNKVFIKKF